MPTRYAKLMLYLNNMLGKFAHSPDLLKLYPQFPVFDACGADLGKGSMDGFDNMAVVAFRERLAAERARLVCNEALKGAMPASGFIAHLADLDSAIAAVEAVIDEHEAGRYKPRAA